MRRIEKWIEWILLILLLPFLPACVEEEIVYSNSVGANFEAAWKIIDEQYCFLEYKGIDWDEVHVRYRQRVGTMTREELFRFIAEMLNELHDGHVNLISSFDVSYYRGWSEDYPVNYNSNILKKRYLGTDYQQAGGVLYKRLNDRVGYCYIGSFSSSISNTNMHHVVNKFAACDVVIIDIRNNGGGNVVTAETVASHCLQERRLIGYTRYKTGKGHADFSDPRPRYLAPTLYARFNQPIYILTNRGAYSAGNEFASMLKGAPGVTLLGDTTGGGGGMPQSSELPIGWSIRFSSFITLDAQMEYIEHGVAPDLKVDLLAEDIERGVDTMIETVLSLYP